MAIQKQAPHSAHNIFQLNNLPHFGMHPQMEALFRHIRGFGTLRLFERIDNGAKVHRVRIKDLSIGTMRTPIEI
jgi:hypothetical protein